MEAASPARAIDACPAELGAALAWKPRGSDDDIIVANTLHNKEEIGAGEEDRTLDIHLGNRPNTDYLNDSQ